MYLRITLHNVYLDNNALCGMKHVNSVCIGFGFIVGSKDNWDYEAGTTASWQTNESQGEDLQLSALPMFSV